MRAAQDCEPFPGESPDEYRARLAEVRMPTLHAPPRPFDQEWDKVVNWQNYPPRERRFNRPSLLRYWLARLAGKSI